MKKSIIKDIYEGKIIPEGSRPTFPEYEELNNKIDQLKNELRTRWKVDMKQIEELSDCYYQIMSSSLEENFISGFKTGAKCMIEILCVEDQKEEELHCKF